MSQSITVTKCILDKTRITPYIDSDGIWQKKNGEAGGLSFWSSGAGVAVKYLVIKSEGWCQCTAVVGHHWWLLVMSWW